MPTATKKVGQRRQQTPGVPARGLIIDMIRTLGGEPEVKRYERVERLERDYCQSDVLHRWKVGNILRVSFQNRDKDIINVYAMGLHCVPQTLKLSVRLAELYDEQQIRRLLLAADAAGFTLNWAHFRQLMREGLSDVQRADLISRVIKGRWGYRMLQFSVDTLLGGKRSQGGRKPGKATYKTYMQALNAMRMRSKTWLVLEEDWIGQVKVLLSKLSKNEKFTPEFLAMTNSAAQQLREVSNKAQLAAEEAEAIAAEVARGMSPESQLKAAVRTVAESAREALSKPKVAAKPRLAKHPKVVNGKFISV